MADDLGWESLPAPTKSEYYRGWTDDPSIGGTLAMYMSKGRVRVYIKDTMLKDYTRTRLADRARPFRVLGIEESSEIDVSFQKPYGCRLNDGRLVCWGSAEEWRHILMALYERSYQLRGSRPYGAVMMRARGRYRDQSVRTMVDDAARKLGIEQIVWLET